MIVSKEQYSRTRGAAGNPGRVKNRIPVISILLVLWAVLGAAQAQASAHEMKLPQTAQHAPSLDQILDKLTGAEINQEGLDQSNLAIDRIVEKADRLIHKAGNESARQLDGKDAHAPLVQVLHEVSLTLMDATSYLLKLKELQSALLTVQTPNTGTKVDARQTCRDLNLKFKAVAADLINLKSGITKLPWRQRAVADVILWKVESKLNSAIQRIRLRTLQIATALTLEAELDLDAR